MRVFHINKTAGKWLISFFIISFLQFIFSNIIIEKVGMDAEQIEKWMSIYEWLILLNSVLCLISIRSIYKSFLTPYTIFLIFLLLFNVGQFIMWALGIHYITPLSKELGISTHIRYLDNLTLLKVMGISLPAISFFHLGYLITNIQSANQKFKTQDTRLVKYLFFRIGIILLVFSSLFVMYQSIHNLSVSMRTGYTSLYYGNESEIGNPIVKYISYMFIPSIFLIFIGSNYSKKVFKSLTIVFLCYLIINLLSGDRGSWIYFICIWLFCYIKLYGFKRDKLKILIKFGILGLLILFSTSVFVAFREIGFGNITKEDIFLVLKNSQMVFIKPIFEMGQSARVLGILVQDNINRLWEYGNTYLYGFISAPLPRIKVLFGFPDYYLDDWLSQVYLGLKNYGVGFSLFAEAFLNGGFLLYPFYVFLIGILIGKVSNQDINVDHPIKEFICLAGITILLPLCRGSFELNMRKFFYGCIVLVGIIYLFKYLAKVRDSS
ncbi:O-antigen polysaccharide polymerase Wzy [Streptococcus cristatus]|uniref:O-antigen polysaccharide polymerase Wzy n=1 Tax=Streptococcus cristatus TaxID=45634 RepID=UPI000660D7DB|nr:O-antigen polysaccharide polymerase Wzy [Streptococcus cristatus]